MTNKQAKRKALVVYKKALRAAERGDWCGARSLTAAFVGDCGFCQACPEDGCPNDCLANHLCQTRRAYMNARKVIRGERTPSDGLRHFRKTIEQLEGLKV